MCKPDGEAGISAECPSRGDCRGCPHAAFGDGVAEDRRASRRARQGRVPAARVGLPETCLRFGSPMPILKKTRTALGEFGHNATSDEPSSVGTQNR